MTPPRRSTGQPVPAAPGAERALPTSPAPAVPWAAALWPWVTVILAAILLFLRKPWALHTPQLYAEDGSVFLVQDEQLGVSAWWTPYNGYLHLLPRLIAWIARHTADPAWWPAIYNSFAFAITVALFARLASSRVNLPTAAKPWLMFAFALTVGTDEVLINVTNLQWVTAFFLLLQLLIARPTSLVQQLGDLAVIALVGLNGPFAIVFLPLFIARAYLARDRASLLALATVASCAAVQLTFLLRSGSGLTLDGGDATFRPLMFVSVIGSRLITWPMLGAGAVRALPIAIHALLAIAVIVPLLLWSLRRDEHRSSRAFLVAAFVLITLPCVYRARADAWTSDNLINGDRYFFIPRVLLAWLLILQFDTAPRWIARTARALCLISVALHLPRFQLPAPTDYEWPRNSAPVRLGIPANIPTLPEGWWIEYPGRPAKP